ncbi:hypothetical protein RJ640_029100 [Escallonia rubra]|uniref:Uncharacterized protein n=1 Tax=Escallonia rubra TaxID=112253 RepID=A0AA88UF00_9ASTE|nr:hypothetical protein RJ640_029100 [Escallonia rubra]
MIWHVQNENFILDSTRIFMKAFHLLLSDASMLAKSEKNQRLFVFLGSHLESNWGSRWWRNWIGKRGILVVRYLMKPSLELRSYSKRKISNIWSFFLYIIWMIRSARTMIGNCLIAFL